ncbi:hypothetical protein E2C01_030571 [Portunus trituberculatus]|uniref:Uncharacterized protein n=1 Tax=Portunus trituberculatus TaxID=210409 RepID=A0A5B7EV53_PORTR|nr:hypothetical protein [Portunus trituberculatus]
MPRSTSYLEHGRRTKVAPEGGEYTQPGTPLPTLTLLLVFQSHKVTNLRTYTQYLVSLQVINPEGLGPTSTVAVMTDEGVFQDLATYHITGFNWYVSLKSLVTVTSLRSSPLLFGSFTILYSPTELARWSFVPVPAVNYPVAVHPPPPFPSPAGPGQEYRGAHPVLRSISYARVQQVASRKPISIVVILKVASTI